MYIRNFMESKMSIVELDYPVEDSKEQKPPPPLFWPDEVEYIKDPRDHVKYLSWMLFYLVEKDYKEPPAYGEFCDFKGLDREKLDKEFPLSLRDIAGNIHRTLLNYGIGKFEDCFMYRGRENYDNLRKVVKQFAKNNKGGKYYLDIDRLIDYVDKNNIEYLMRPIKMDVITEVMLSEPIDIHLEDNPYIKILENELKKYE